MIIGPTTRALFPTLKNDGWLYLLSMEYDKRHL